MKGSYERVARYLLRVHSSPWRWAIALLVFVIALALRFALHGILPAGHPFLTFFRR